MTHDAALAQLAGELAAPRRGRPEDLLAALALLLDDGDEAELRAV